MRSRVGQGLIAVALAWWWWPLASGSKFALEDGSRAALALQLGLVGAWAIWFARSQPRPASVPHYHVAVFPQQYRAYVDGIARGSSVRVASASARPAPSPAPEYKVRSGDSLWDIARSHGTTVAEIRSANNLRNSTIYAGQVLEIPRGR